MACEVEDCNGDGIIDVALGTGFLVRMQNAQFFSSTNQAVRFEYPIVYTGVPYSPITSSVKITDIEGDGDNDILSTSVNEAYHFHENIRSEGICRWY